MNEDVVFWKWTSPETLGIVTNTAVYHWAGSATTGAADAPVKIFDRHVSLTDHQIINYRVSGDEKWAALVGISANTVAGGFKVKGSIQLYSRDRGVSQPIEGHAASFAEIRLDGASVDSKLFTFAVRTATGAKVSGHVRDGGGFVAKLADVLRPAPHCRDRPPAQCPGFHKEGCRRFLPSRWYI